MEPVEIMILVIIVAVFVKFMIVDSIPEFKAEFIVDTKELIHSVTTWKFLAISLIILYPFIYFLIGFLINFWSRLKDKLGEKKRAITMANERIKNLLNKHIKPMNIIALKEFIIELEKGLDSARDMEEVRHYKKHLELKIRQAKARLMELRAERNLEKMREERNIVEKQIEIMEERLKKERLEKLGNTTEIWRGLNAYEIHVFLKEELEPHQIDALLKHNFVSVNEYCVFEKKIISVLLKRTMHHSATHTFLVWSVGRLLESLQGLSGITEHDTVDADITFKHKKDIYALEIETGTILSKQYQLRAKVSYLNRKYPGRWIFIVSNKNLISKYRKFGPVTTRKDAEENIKKMLKIS